MTNLGLRTQLPIYVPRPRDAFYQPRTCIAILNCYIEKVYSGPVAIRLKQIFSGEYDQYTRIGDVDELLGSDILDKTLSKIVYISLPSRSNPARDHAFYVP
jgi:hypothetical protein